MPPPGVELLDTEAYRQRVLARLEASACDDERHTVREQLSGACTTEIVALQDHPRRAQIEPWAWAIKKSIAVTGTTDPLLQARLAGEIRQTERIAGGLAKRTFVLPWLPESPVGVAALGELVK